MDAKIVVEENGIKGFTMNDLTYMQSARNAICSACGKIDCDRMDCCEKLQLPTTSSPRSHGTKGRKRERIENMLNHWMKVSDRASDKGDKRKEFEAITAMNAIIETLGVLGYSVTLEGQEKTHILNS